MKKTVGSFTESQLQELSEQPNVVVYQPTHDFHFQPWSSSTVDEYVDKLILATNKWKGDEKTLRKQLTNDTNMCEFAARYKTFFEKLTTPSFVQDSEHVNIVRQMLNIRKQVETGTLSETDAKVKVADVALVSLVGRAQSSSTS